MRKVAKTPSYASLSGFVRREYTWQLKISTEQRFSQYRLCDNYLRFYLKHIQPKMNKIRKGQLDAINPSLLLGYEIIMELQFENLILNKSIVSELKEKINMPKRFAAITILVHVNGADNNVLEANYFGRICDLNELLG